jgi:hypothetical protein
MENKRRKFFPDMLPNIYDGIDIVYYGNGKKLEYDFIVAPNANLHSIRLQYEGAEGNIFLAEDGSEAARIKRFFFRCTAFIK